MPVKLAIAPIGWSNDDVPELGGEITFEQCVSEMALAGYQGCEVGHKFPTDVAELRKALRLRNLQVCNKWFTFYLTSKSLAEVREEFENHLDFLEAMGSKVVNGAEFGNANHQKGAPVLEEKVVFTEDQWQKVTNGLNELGKMAEDRGIKLAYHHHMGTGVQSMAETNRLLESTDPQYVYLTYDCGHFTFAGEDPLAALNRFKDRVAHVHLKDVRPKVLSQVKAERMGFMEAVIAGVFTVPGDREGSVDFPSIFALFDEAGYDGWLVVEAEQDPAKANPLEYAIMAMNYLKQNLPPALMNES